MKCKSEWQRPATAVRIRTSRGPGLVRLTSSITSGLLISCRTAAFIFVSSSLCIHFVACPSPLPMGPMGELKIALAARSSLCCRNPFTNFGHAGRAIAEQQRGDLLLWAVFRKPERIARHDAVIDHQPRQQKPARIAASCVDALRFPGELYRACDVIEQAGRPAGF